MGTQALQEAEEVCDPLMETEGVEEPCLSGRRGLHDFISDYHAYLEEYYARD